MEKNKLDYKKLLKESGPDQGTLRRGQAARKQRMETAKNRITIRIDEDILEDFKDMVPEGKGYQSLINRALREWLDARGVKELISKELPGLLGKAVSAVQSEK